MLLFFFGGFIADASKTNAAPLGPMLLTNLSYAGSGGGVGGGDGDGGDGDGDGGDGDCDDDGGE